MTTIRRTNPLGKLFSLRQVVRRLVDERAISTEATKTK